MTNYLSTHLQLLALQSIPKISEKLGIKTNLPNFFELYGSPPESCIKVMKKLSNILEEFINKYKISWWDIYIESDIGKERVLITKEIDLSKEDYVVDFGCGRGYSTIAVAKLVSYVIGIDLMNGFGRYNWWLHFNKAMKLLKLDHKVQGIRTNAIKTPFKDSYFDVTITVHSLRNFHSINEIVQAIREMKRITKENKYIFIVENLREAKNVKQRIHLKLHSLRVRLLHDELNYFSKEELIRIVNNVGFKDIEIKIVNYNLCSTPVIFYINQEKYNRIENNILNEYKKTIKLVRRIGEESTPVIIIKAKKK